jgi:hypothetical protein
VRNLHRAICISLSYTRPPVGQVRRQGLSQLEINVRLITSLAKRKVTLLNTSPTCPLSAWDAASIWQKEWFLDPLSCNPPQLVN